MLFRLLVFLILACCCSAKAAEINAIPLNKPGQGAIFVNGDIKYEDRDKFLTKVSPFSGGVVIFDSRGGSAFAGIGIGRAIRMRGFTTWVPSGSFCASACAIAWLGGTRRLMGKAALIGFHSVYTVENGTAVEAGAGNAVYGAYLSQLGLSDRAIMYLSNAAPTSMNWLTPAEAESFGIDLTVFDPKMNQTASAPPAPYSGDLETRSRNFVIALNVIISGPTEQYLRLLNGIYADQVLYFGKLMQRADVVNQLTKFIARWPIRSYVARPESLKLQCNAQTSQCHISGLIDFDAKSPPRNQWSHGVATFDYLLSFRPGARWPVIVNEGGSVVSRKMEALQTVTPPAGNELGLAR
jgi:hypothetical protein